MTVNLLFHSQSQNISVNVKKRPPYNEQSCVDALDIRTCEGYVLEF